MSTSKRPAPEDHTANPRKSHRSAANENAEAQEQEPILVPTNVENVHEILGDACPSMDTLRTETSDWSDPIILMISRETRDALLQYLQKLNTVSVTNVVQEQEHRPTADATHPTEDTDAVFCENNYSTETSADITEFNKTTIELIEEKYESTKKQLDEIQNGFSEPELKRNVNSEEQFHKLKYVRKKITQFHVACSKTLKTAHLQTSTRKHYICQIQKNMIPNRFTPEVIHEVDDHIDKFASKINADLCTHMLADTQNIIRDTQQLISNEDKLILAKSWRSIKISQKRNQHTYRQHEDNERYKPRRRSTYFDRQQFDDRERRIRSSHQDEQNNDNRDRKRIPPQTFYRHDRNTNQYGDNARYRYREQNYRNDDDHRERRHYYADRHFDRRHDSYGKQYYRNYDDYGDERDYHKDRHFDRRQDSYQHKRRWYDENFPSLRHSTENDRNAKN